jgi:hypothetical protein
MSEAEDVQRVYESLKRDFPDLKEGKIAKKLWDIYKGSPKSEHLYWLWLDWRCKNETDTESV